MRRGPQGLGGGGGGVSDGMACCTFGDLVAQSLMSVAAPTCEVGCVCEKRGWAGGAGGERCRAGRATREGDLVSSCPAPVPCVFCDWCWPTTVGRGGGIWWWGVWWWGLRSGRQCPGGRRPPPLLQRPSPHRYRPLRWLGRVLPHVMPCCCGRDGRARPPFAVLTLALGRPIRADHPRPRSPPTDSLRVPASCLPCRSSP